MSQQTILITFDQGGNPVPLSADGAAVEISRHVQPDDQIRWLSPHGKVSVAFAEKSPFRDGSMTGDAAFRACPASGTFKYNCTVITPDGRSHGWPENSVGGGTVVVGGGTR